jgi:hypothetical protein
MAADPLPEPRRRRRLSRERVLQTAMDRADQGGLEALTMRTLADELGVAPMALYRHVVFGEIGLPSGGADWKTAMRQRANSLRDVLVRHRWAIGLMEARRNPGPANLRHHDAVIGKLRAAGFSVEATAHAYSVLDSYIYGFALTKLNLPFEASDDVGEMAASMLEPFPVNEYPNLVEFVSEHVMKPGYDYGAEFEYGLDVVLDGLEAARQTAV